MTNNRTRDFLGLLGFALASVVTSAFGGAVTATSVDTWYQTLDKPAFNPPDWLFPPVWSALFALMAVAGWRIWRRRGVPGRGTALTLYALQLGLNALWSLLFFGLRAPGAALVDILVLLAVLAVTTALFARIDRWAAVFFLPYPLWVAFAALLNGAIVSLN